MFIVFILDLRKPKIINFTFLLIPSCIRSGMMLFQGVSQDLWDDDVCKVTGIMTIEEPSECFSAGG